MKEDEQTNLKKTSGNIMWPERDESSHHAILTPKTL